MCLNVDKAWFAEHDVAPPATLDDLVKPGYEKLLVVENPATSTPGLAFMLATSRASATAVHGRPTGAHFVRTAFWWWTAGRRRTTSASRARAGKGDRPIVVSYASSPPVEVVYAKPRPKDAPTAVVEATCFRQVELAGVLRGAPNEDGAKKLVDFMLAKRFQEAIPLSMFVFPVNRDAALPPVFEKYAAVPPSPLDLSPAEIGANRERWVDEWTRIVLR